MNEVNIRYGVVNEKKRNDYEKQWQIQMGYDFISYDSDKAIEVCRKKGIGFVVEKISNINGSSVNYKTTIFRGGNSNEKNYRTR